MRVVALDTKSQVEGMLRLKGLLWEEGHDEEKEGESHAESYAESSRTTKSNASADRSNLTPSCPGCLLRSSQDLHNFWVPCRVLSPIYLQNLMHRYNNGFSVLSMLMITGMTGTVILQVSTAAGTAGSSVPVNSPDPGEEAKTQTVYWPLIFELGYLCLFTAISICFTILYGVRCNDNLRKLASSFRTLETQTGHARGYNGSNLVDNFEALPRRWILIIQGRKKPPKPSIAKNSLPWPPNLPMTSNLCTSTMRQ